MRTLGLALVLVIAACDGTSSDLTTCGKLLCGPDEYCEHFIPGRPDTDDPGMNEPTCRTGPPACDSEPACDCLTECTDCEVQEDGGVHCTIAAP